MYFTPRRTFYPVALKPLRIVTKLLWLFLNICVLNNAKKISYIRLYFQYGGWKMDTQLKKLKNSILRGYFVSKTHWPKTKFQLLCLCFQWQLCFNGNNIDITKCSRHTGNKYGGQKAEVVSVRQMLLTSQRCTTVIVCFRGCARHRS